MMVAGAVSCARGLSTRTSRLTRVPDAERIRALTTQALDEFDSGKPTSALVRQAHRIAVLRHDYAAQIWFGLQQRDLQAAPESGRFLDLKARLVALLGEDAGMLEFAKQVLSYQASRQMLDSKNFYGLTVDQLETTIAELEDISAPRDVPSNLHSLDAGMLIKRQEDAQAKVFPQLAQLRSILSRIRPAIHEYLVATEAELDAGREESSFFDQVYTRINGLLNTYAPEAAKKFVAAQDRVTSGGPEDISHALTSCRRMIKSLADTLYPATNEEKAGLDGVGRKMSDEAYKNRLLQFVGEKIGKHKSGGVLQEVISDLGKRLDTLDALSSKGVHAEPSIAEAHTCVVQTYLLAGDLLAIAEGTSLQLRDEAPTDEKS